jgi:hypothetical protein
MLATSAAKIDSSVVRRDSDILAFQLRVSAARGAINKQIGGKAWPHYSGAYRIVLPLKYVSRRSQVALADNSARSVNAHFTILRRGRKALALKREENSGALRGHDGICCPLRKNEKELRTFSLRLRNVGLF